MTSHTANKAMHADFLPRAFGAAADGLTKDTAALQAAIDAAGAAGGGRVVLDRGTFLTGAIELRSGVELHIAEGARLLASPDIADFPDWPAPRHVIPGNLPRRRSASVIFADECEGVAITGGGVIDGNGAFHVRPGDGAPAPCGWSFVRIQPMEKSLPRVVFFAGCRDVRVEDVTLANGPAGWGYWIHDCDRVSCLRLTIRSDLHYPNNDGIHVNCSRDVEIADCDIECGDDAIVARANSRSLREDKPCERVHAHDCRIRSWCGGVRIAWVNDGAIRDCSFRRLAMRDTCDGVRIVMPHMPKHPDYGREATLVERIVFEDIDMEGLHAYPIDAWIDPDPETRVAAVRDVAFRRVRAESNMFPRFVGRADAPFENFLFEDCSFRLIPNGAEGPWAQQVATRPGNVEGRFRNTRGFRFVRTERWPDANC